MVLQEIMTKLEADSFLAETARAYGYNPADIIACPGAMEVASDEAQTAFQWLSYYRPGDAIMLGVLFQALYDTGPGELHAGDVEFAIDVLMGPNVKCACAFFKPIKSYSEYLLGEHWRGKVRPAVLERAGHRCQLCGAMDKTLHVHHNSYERLGNELPWDLIVLCEDCHAKYHGKRN